MGYKLLLFIVVLFTCNSSEEFASQGKDENVKKPPTRRQLFRKQFELKEINIITPKTAAYTNLMQTMAGEAGRGIKIKYTSTDEWEGKNVGDKALFLIGSLDQHSILQQLQAELPFSWQSASIDFANKAFNHPETVLKISLFPNPYNPEIPLYLLTGLKDEHIISFIQEKYEGNWSQLIWSSFGYQVFEKNTCAISGFFSEKDWSVDKKLHWDFHSVRSDTLESPHFKFIQHQPIFNNEGLRELANNCEAACEKIETFFGKSAQEKINYHIYESMEIKGLMLSNTSHSHSIPQRNEVHAIHSEAFMGNQIQSENQLLIQQLAGAPNTPWLSNGLSIRFSEKWQRFGFKYWAKRLLTSDNLPAIEELIDPELKGFESAIVLGAGQAALVDYLITLWGRDKFINQYKNWNPSLSEIKQLEKGFKKHINEYKTQKLVRTKKALPYLKGFNFAHEGYQIYNGYGSDLAEASLKKAKQLGTNAIAIVPYSYMRDHQAPSRIPIVDNPGAETDESVIHSIQHAKEMDMQTMLKPQLWLGRSWTGFIDMKSQKDWDLFFEHYYRWIRHFALLAEIYEVDIFSVGVEFVQATLKNEAVWKEMFEKIRKLYSGQLTYCANWGDEFEKINFWEPLDFIGLNCYYPIGRNEKERPKVLSDNFAAITKKIETIANRSNKKIVFTEIGFRSVTAPWVNPHAEAVDRGFSEKDQAACYQAVFENIKDKEWCNGILWWKWPCYLGHRGPENTSFAPAGKITEQVIEEWFKQ